MDALHQHEPTPPASARSSLPSLRLSATAVALAAVVVATFVWGGGWGYPPSGVSLLQPAFRYVNSGWVEPTSGSDLGPFADELRAFVIVSQEELDAFEGGYISKVSRGSFTSLGRIDFEQSVLLAAYYIWRPERGDPLSVVDVEYKGANVLVKLELDDDAQGREYAYLYAPMVMVAMDQTLFPKGEAVQFQVDLNGQPNQTLTAVPNP